MSSVKLVLTAQDEFITESSKTLYFVGVSHGNILAHDPHPATGAVENRRIFALAMEPSRTGGAPPTAKTFNVPTFNVQTLF